MADNLNKIRKILISLIFFVFAFYSAVAISDTVLNHDKIKMKTFQTEVRTFETKFKLHKKEEPSSEEILVLLVLWLIPLILCMVLAKEKGCNVWLWAILGLPPFLNFFTVILLFLMPNLKYQQQMDKLIEILQRQEKQRDQDEDYQQQIDKLAEILQRQEKQKRSGNQIVENVKEITKVFLGFLLSGLFIIVLITLICFLYNVFKPWHKP